MFGFTPNEHQGSMSRRAAPVAIQEKTGEAPFFATIQVNNSLQNVRSHESYGSILAVNSAGLLYDASFNVDCSLVGNIRAQDCYL
eukprot:scaffold93366_cov14-Prasinocladus_malaysianus.AAC.1